MNDAVEVIKTKDELLGCNTCRSYEDVYDIRLKTGSSTTVLRLCNDCFDDLKNKFDSLKK